MQYEVTKKKKDTKKQRLEMYQKQMQKLSGKEKK